MKLQLVLSVAAVGLAAACTRPAPPPPDPQPATASKHAKNVILLLADAGGIPTLDAASILGYGKPLALNVQSWPYFGLSETSTATDWVTDSAAGMTAIVTGTKTVNGVLSEGPETLRGKQNGAPLTTILERAEDRGLSTGVISSQTISDATPAACYAHSSDRDADPATLFVQAFQPRFGDGVDVLIGSGRGEVEEGARKAGLDLSAIAAGQGRHLYAALKDVPASETRPVVMIEGNVDIPRATRMALSTLARNPKGYFLMIEWDAHTIDVESGLRNVIGFDKLAAEIARSVNLDDTLVLFTADHSFDLRMVGGTRGQDLLTGLDRLHRSADDKTPLVLPAVEVTERHTGEEVLVTGIGATAEQLHGHFPNTHIFQIMMTAFGWDDRVALTPNARP